MCSTLERLQLAGSGESAWAAWKVGTFLHDRELLTSVTPRVVEERHQSLLTEPPAAPSLWPTMGLPLSQLPEFRPRRGRTPECEPWTRSRRATLTQSCWVLNCDLITEQAGYVGERVGHCSLLLAVDCWNRCRR